MWDENYRGMWERHGRKNYGRDLFCGLSWKWTFLWVVGWLVGHSSSYSANEQYLSGAVSHDLNPRFHESTMTRIKRIREVKRQDLHRLTVKLVLVLGEGSHAWGTDCLKNFNQSKLLTVFNGQMLFPQNLKSILTENVLSCTIRADLTNFVFFLFFQFS